MIAGLVAFVVVMVALPCAAQEPSLDFLEVPARPDDDRPRADREDVDALAELEREMARFDASARGYRESVDALVRRRLQDQRRVLAARYARRLRQERALEADARRRTMAELRSFLARHPRADRYRADVMLRLAELTLLAALDDAGEGTPDLRRATALAQQIVREYPQYRAIDRAAYLAGYGLYEAERYDEALAMWRGLVCASRFGFEPADRTIEDAPPPHPALARRGPPSIGADPYEGCVPAMESPLLSEIWLRIGEHHFDRGNGELAAAIGAYRNIVDDPSDPLYGLGLYKLAWSSYRASRFTDAIDQFGRLAAWSDERLARTGRAGSDLRAEAIRYVAIALAYDDWNEDGTPDGELPLARATAMLPSGEPWAHDAMRALGEVLFDEARYPEAIAVWRETLGRYPGACDHADLLLAIASAHRRQLEEERALAVLGEIPQLLDTPMNSGRSCSPEDARRAEGVARDVTLSIAIFHHRRAQQLRARGDLGALNEYARAVESYRVFVERFPNDPRAYAIQYDMADALYWSGRYLRAARMYEAVRDSNLDDRYFAASARRVVESYTRALEEEVAAGAIALREQAPIANRSVRPVEVPLALQRVARAREIYVRWVDREEDTEHVRDAYAFNNALLLERYGFWAKARERFDELFASRCRGAEASDVGRSAWMAMHRMASAVEDVAEIERLNAALREGACTFDPSGSPVIAEGCVVPGSPACIAQESDTLAALTRLRREIAELDAQSDSPARRERAESIAARLIGVVDRDPRHAQAQLALSSAAHVLADVARHPAAAERVYQRIVDEGGGSATLVLDARFQIARIAHRAFDIERALAGYAAVASSPRSDEAAIASMQEDAIVNAAILASSSGRHAEASDAWSRVADRVGGAGAREARLRSAEERLRAGDARGAAGLLDAWLRSSAAGDALTVRAHIERANAARAQRDATGRTRSLEAAVRVSRQSGATPELAAPAALELADARAASFRPEPIRVPVRASIADARDELAQRVRRESARYRPLLDAYDAVIAMGRPRESQAALERQGALLEGLIRTVLEAEVEVPRDLARTLRAASPAVRDEGRARFAEVIRARLDGEVRPVECRAIEHYLLATRLAQREGSDAPAALARLAAYGEERVRECVRVATQRDPSFAPLAPSELTRSRPGLAAPPADGTAPPSLAR